MKRALFLLPFLLLAGCGVDRKAQLETRLPELISAQMQRLASPSNTAKTAVCKNVILVQETKGHYTGTVFFTDGRQTKITVVDDGDNIQFDTAPF